MYVRCMQGEFRKEPSIDEIPKTNSSTEVHISRHSTEAESIDEGSINSSSPEDLSPEIRDDLPTDSVPSSIDTYDTVDTTFYPFVEYDSVKIGDQTWMKMNLDVGHFRNGDEIFYAETEEQWQTAIDEKRPAWCYYENDHTNNQFGKLYNRYAVLDPRGLAPGGWSIPTDDQWDDLTNTLILNHIEKNELLHSNVVDNNNLGFEYNKTGFSALGSGYRDQRGNFVQKSIGAYWWTKTFLPSIKDKDRCKFIRINEISENVILISQKYELGHGFSVRCLRTIS